MDVADLILVALPKLVPHYVIAPPRWRVGFHYIAVERDSSLRADRTLDVQRSAISGFLRRTDAWRNAVVSPKSWPPAPGISNFSRVRFRSEL
jgi:hypothetical protein